MESRRTTKFRERAARFRRVWIALIGATFLLPVAGPAHADQVEGAYTANLGPGLSYQFMRWSQPDRKIRLAAKFAGDSDTAARCHDAAVDWFTNGTGHYDARVVRNCNPGGYVETDPGGDGFWKDPQDFDEADVTRVQRVGAYVFSDSNLSNIVADDPVYGGTPSSALATSNFSQRIRTLYDNGQVASHDHYPVRCATDATWIGYPGSNGGRCV